MADTIGQIYQNRRLWPDKKPLTNSNHSGSAGKNKRQGKTIVKASDPLDGSSHAVQTKVMA